MIGYIASPIRKIESIIHPVIKWQITIVLLLSIVIQRAPKIIENKIVPEAIKDEYNI